MLSFAEGIRRALFHNISLSGRSCRSEFWWLYLASIPSFFLATFIARLGGLLSLAGLALSLATFALVIACMVRRLHDRNLSGLLVLVIFIPTIGLLILLVLCAFKGTYGPNKYGLDPLQFNRGSNQSYNFGSNNEQDATFTPDNAFERKITQVDQEEDKDSGSYWKP